MMARIQSPACILHSLRVCINCVEIIQNQSANTLSESCMCLAGPCVVAYFSVGSTFGRCDDGICGFWAHTHWASIKFFNMGIVNEILIVTRNVVAEGAVSLAGECESRRQCTWCVQKLWASECIRLFSNSSNWRQRGKYATWRDIWTIQPSKMQFSNDTKTCFNTCALALKPLWSFQTMLRYVLLCVSLRSRLTCGITGKNASAIVHATGEATEMSSSLGAWQESALAM